MLTEEVRRQIGGRRAVEDHLAVDRGLADLADQLKPRQALRSHGDRSDGLRAMVSAMPSARAICVFCGASPGDHPAFVAAAEALGRAAATSGRPLIYGGSKTGIMGALANA